MIELAVLGLLKETDLHGYELKKRLGSLLGRRSTVSFGSLYPALSRLEKSGAVKAVEANVEPGPTMPMTGALSGEVAAFRARLTRPTRGLRGKKVYGITDVGRQRLTDLLTEETDERSDDRVFTLRVAFCRYLTPGQRLTLFKRRHDDLCAERDDGDDESALDTYLRALRERNRRAIEFELAWLEGLMEQERRAADEPIGDTDATTQESGEPR